MVLSHTTRTRLRNVANHKRDSEIRIHEHQLQSTEWAKLLFQVVKIFQSQGLEASSPSFSSFHVFSFSIGHLALHVEMPSSIANGKLEGELRDRLRDSGGVVATVRKVHLASLVWDLSDQSWYGRGGEEAIDIVVNGILDALHVDAPTRPVLPEASGS